MFEVDGVEVILRLFGLAIKKRAVLKEKGLFQTIKVA